MKPGKCSYILPNIYKLPMILNTVDPASVAHSFHPAEQTSITCDVTVKWLSRITVTYKIYEYLFNSVERSKVAIKVLFFFRSLTSRTNPQLYHANVQKSQKRIRIQKETNWEFQSQDKRETCRNYTESSIKIIFIRNMTKNYF